MNKQNWFKRF